MSEPTITATLPQTAYPRSSAAPSGAATSSGAAAAEDSGFPAAHGEQPVDAFIPSQTDDEMNQMCQLRRLSMGQAPDRCESGFEYAPVALQDLREAKGWDPESGGMSGSDANATINQTYDTLDKDMTRYLGEPPVANWMTFGKYASREAGEQIRNLENVERAASGDLDAAARVAGDMAEPTAAMQALLLGADTAKRVYDDENGQVVTDTVPQVFDTLSTMRDALVEGNTEIYQNIAPAFDAFLRGEADPASSGLQALAEAGYEKGSKKDPQGFVTAAFEKYAQARQKGLEANEAGDPAERQRLLDERAQLVGDANLQIGLQEQMTILQRNSIYGDRDMQAALGAVSGTMSLRDANGTHALRPDGRNWSGFADRMGLRETSPDDPNGIAVTDPKGRTRHYVPDPSQKGTIVEYFTENLEGDAARTLIEGSPRPL